MTDQAGTVSFGPEGRFELQPVERRLLVAGVSAPLGSRAFDLLLELVSQPGTLRTKHELMEAVWPGVIVEEGNLSTQISTLRKILGGDVIATVPGRGYRFTSRLVQGARTADPIANAQPAASAEWLAPLPAKLPTNLPERLPALLGREQDLVSLATMVQDHPLVTLIGPGGTGKTRLAQAFLHASREFYPHAVCWVDLSSVGPLEEVSLVVGSALGLNLGSGDPLRTLCELASPLQMLVALDNAEHRVEAVAELVHALGRAAPGLRLLVTSQVPLQLAAERVWRVEALAVPDGPLAAEAALGFGAVALFAERAQASDARWCLNDDNVAAVIEVCRSLDGLPLAIELAAVRAPMLGVQKLAASMDDRLKILNASRNRVAPARQQTLRAALEWSHGFLDEPQRTVFRRLAVFSGTGSLRMIQQVVADADGELDQWAVLDALALLVDRSLVKVITTDDGAEPRYRLLESPRAFALERLREAGEEALIRGRHLRVVASLCEAAWHIGHSGDVGLQDFAQSCLLEAENAREAMAQALATGEREAALQVAAVRLWNVDDLPAAQRLEVVAQCLTQLDDSLPPSLHARTWVQISRAFAQGRLRRSLEAARLAQKVVKRSDDPSGDSFLSYLVCCSLAQAAARGQGAGAEARAALDEARALEDPRWPPHRRLWRVQAEFAAAEPGTATALRLCREWLALDLASGGSGYTVRTRLIEAELASGDARAAVQTGEALLEDLQGSRHEVALTSARLCVAAAWLTLGDAQRVRSVAQAGWSKGPGVDLRRRWAAYLALLAAQESRLKSAAFLAGYAQGGEATREDIPEPQEAAAHALACTLARAALGDAEFDRLRAEGRLLRDDQIEAIAFEPLVTQPLIPPSPKGQASSA